MNQNSDSRESVETRQRIQQQTELITALLAEIRELENDFSRRDDSATRQAQEEASHEYDEYQSSSRMRSIVLVVTSGFPLMNVMS